MGSCLACCIAFPWYCYRPCCAPIDIHADLIDIQHGLSRGMAGLVRLAEQLKTTLAQPLAHLCLLRSTDEQYFLLGAVSFSYILP